MVQLVNQRTLMRAREHSTNLGCPGHPREWSMRTLADNGQMTIFTSRIQKQTLADVQSMNRPLGGIHYTAQDHFSKGRTSWPGWTSSSTFGSLWLLSYACLHLSIALSFSFHLQWKWGAEECSISLVLEFLGHAETCTHLFFNHKDSSSSAVINLLTDTLYHLRFTLKNI